MEALEKVSIILSLFRNNSSLSLAEIITMTPMTKSSTFRTLQSMERYDFIRRTEKGCVRYELSPLYFKYGVLYKNRLKINEIVLPVLEQLAQRFTCSTFFSVYDAESKKALFLEKIEWKYYISDVFVTVGDCLPMNAGAAPLALITELSLEEMENIVAKNGLTVYNANTIATQEGFFKEREKNIARGFSFANEDVSMGFCSIGTTIFDATGKCCGAISMADHKDLFFSAKFHEMLKSLLRASVEISKQFGGEKKVNFDKIPTTLV